jgi:hypothetical protein
MASLDSAPLRRRLDALTGAVRREVGRRQELRERAEIWAALGPALAEWRIDPKVISGLWTISGAEAELHRRGDCPDLQRADAAFVAQDPELAARKPYAAGLAERARKFFGKPPPDPRRTSLSDWCAWGLAVEIAGRIAAEGVAGQAGDLGKREALAPGGG